MRSVRRLVATSKVLNHVLVSTLVYQHPASSRVHECSMGNGIATQDGEVTFNLVEHVIII